MEKKKLAIIADCRNWSFHSIAKIMKKELKDICNTDIFFSKEEPYVNDFFKLIEDVKSYDVIHFLWRRNLMDFESEDFKNAVKASGYNYDEYVSTVCNKITTAVYDTLLISSEEIDKYAPIFTKYSRKYYTCSKKLDDIYCNIAKYPKPSAILIDTYEKELFYPQNLERFDGDNSRPLIVGWVGNSKWNSKDKSGIDFKGLHTILEPVLDELIKAGYNIQKKYADRQIKFTPSEEMVHYYKDIDVYITCSYHEGTPRPALESMACGVPIIATDVGIVPEILGPLQSEFIIGDRVKLSDDIIRQKLKEAILKLYNDRALLKKLSDENINKAKTLDSSNFKEPYIDFFFN